MAEIKSGDNSINYNEHKVDEHSKIFTIVINGIIQRRWMTYNDLLYCEDGPADIEYYNNGQTKREAYCKSKMCPYTYDKNHAAIIEYYENGNKRYEMYNTKEGNGPHRSDGPAVIYYNEDGSIKDEFFYLHGEVVDDVLTVEILRSCKGEI